ncbi:hypothetical protein MKK65_26115 [Methylobacterium sp. J-001]|uniref:hypothetical protein n=1 Tax=Methylobacterium sp. J-001 TaxID=2836609 RepID=UPI001FBA4482|nr:hypothetical protein [Methylobacterium sp. J-001]MCJ2120006.1 hypothetical protein [Methylobacterium sp. J-001]
MDEALLAFLGSLVEIKTELGPNVYDAALERARLAIAAEVMVEAERAAFRRAQTPAMSNVIVFPFALHAPDT